MEVQTTEVEYPTVTRFEVIDQTEGGAGRMLVRFGVNVMVSTQDDGLTMKVFLTDREEEADAAGAVWHESLGNDLERLNAQLP